MRLLFVPTGGGGYSILPGPNQRYKGFTNNPALGDDQCGTVTLPFPFTHASGTTSTVSVSSNGFVWLGSNTNSACCTGVSATFLDDLMARIAPCRMDFYPPCGERRLRDPLPDHDQRHAPGAGRRLGRRRDPGSRQQQPVVGDHRAAVDGRLRDADDPEPSARPVLGTSTNLDTGAIVAGSLVGINSLGFGLLNPGVDLTPFGAPACSLYLNAGYNAIFVVSGATNSMPLGIPVTPSLAGIHVFAQSVVFAPGVNALGLITSNGVNLGLGNL